MMPSRGYVLSAFLALAMSTSGALWAQSPKEQARIDFETAKLALQQGKPDAALKKFEAVMAALGDFPELDYYAASAALQAGDLEAARRYKERCFAAADPGFRKGALYPKLIQLSAQLEAQSTASADQLAALGLDHWSERRAALVAKLDDCYTDYDLLVPGAITQSRMTTSEVSSNPDFNQPSESTVSEVELLSADVSDGRLVKRTRGEGRENAEWFACTEQGLVRAGDPHAPETQFQTEGLHFPRRPRPGLSWTVKGGNKEASSTDVYTIQSQGPVTVAGRQLMSWLVTDENTMIMNHGGRNRTSMTRTGRYWWVEGLGVVKSESTGHSTHYHGDKVITSTSTFSWELLSVRVPPFKP